MRVVDVCQVARENAVEFHRCETDKGYGFGTLRWTPRPDLRLTPGLTPKNMDDPAVAAARRFKPIRDFLYWSRLPFARVERSAAGTSVTVSDARYSDGAAASRSLSRC